MDYWPLGRLKQRVSAKKIQTKPAKPIIADKRKGKPAKGNAVIKEETEATRPVDSKYRWTLIMQLVWEKTPLFILAILSSIVTYIVQHEGGAVGSLESIPLSVRIGNAFLSYITYIVNMIWPHNLAVFYPYYTWASRQVFGAALVFITITLIIVWTAKRFEYLTAGWLWYVGTLVPVIGLVKVGLQARADRYTYIPLIGLFIMGAWGITELLRQWRHRKKVLVASSSLALSFFFIITWTQVGYWQNSFTLFNHALEVTHDNSVAYDCRGSAYVIIHNYKEALMDYDRAIRINPKLASAYNNRGLAYGALGRQTEAIADYSMAIQINPEQASTYNDRGNAYIDLGNYEQAIMDFDKAIRINPEYAGAYNNRGLAYGALGRQTEAIAD
jgi:hypothetical protein